MRICARPGTSLSRTLGYSRALALYQELAMGRKRQGYGSGAAKDALPGGSLVSLGSLYVCEPGYLWDMVV